MKPIFFPTPKDFRSWLEKNHKTEKELFVGFYKIKTKKQSISWSESVDQALCFGWIDGVRKSVDEESYSIRFTPRKPSSIWSIININKIEELKKAGLMRKAGLDAFELRRDDKSGIYSHEKESTPLNFNFEKLFKSNIKAWDYFNKQPQSYKKRIIHWIMSAKQEKTKLSRLEKTIQNSENERRMI